ncbi:MAG: hypothetical protein AAFY29_01800 [Pseudomonadota bacterium]
MSYSTPTLSGITNPAGEFRYEVGETVEFNLGASPLGATLGGAEITLFDLQHTAAVTDIRTIVSALNQSDSAFTRTLNIVRILYSLDDDLNPDNGISLNVEVNELLDFRSVPRRFAYSEGVGRLLTLLDRKLMPLEISLAHQYEMAKLPLIEDGVALTRRTQDRAIEADGGVLQSRLLATYRYNDFGSLEHEDRFDDQGQLASSTVFEFRDEGLRFLRRNDDDADGLFDFEIRATHNTAGDVVGSLLQSSTGAFPDSLTVTRFDTEGLVFENTTDSGNDGSVEFKTTRTRSPDIRTERIEVSSSMSAENAYVITNTFDENGLLLEQSFEGTGIDEHEFLDGAPPPLAQGPIDPFDPLHPYWGQASAFLAAGPTTAISRYTRYHRDSQGRVIGRSTDTNGDEIPDQIARLDYENGRPAAWFYDREGDGEFESTANYDYRDDGSLRSTEIERLTQSGLALETRAVELNDDGLRGRIDTVASGVAGFSNQQIYDYDDGALALSQITSDALGVRETDWEQSYRPDDSVLYSLTPTPVGPYQYEYRDVGEPEIRDVDGNLITSEQDQDDRDISLHFEGLTTTYTARLILSGICRLPAGFDIVYQEPPESCAANDATVPLAPANDDGSRPERAYYRLDDNRIYIPDPTRNAISARIGSVYVARTQSCSVAQAGEEGLFYALVPTNLVIRYPLMVEGSDEPIEPQLDLID